MKNITLSAPERLIEAARIRAATEQTTLNAVFRDWLESYVQRKHEAQTAADVINRIGHYAQSGGRKFTREEMNER